LRSRENGIQAEGQYLFDHDLFDATAGFATYYIDSSLRDFIVGTPPDHTDETWTQNSGYVYSSINFPQDLIWTLGFSYDDFDDETNHVEAFSPKMGVEWNMIDNVRLRLAAFQTVKPALVTNQTIQPTEVAGFNKFFDDVNGTKSWRYGAGLDARMTEGLYGGVETSWRDLDVPSGGRTQNWDEALYRAYLYWTPHPEWAMRGEVRFDAFDKEKGGS
jgi:hypothetical protein